MSSQHLRTRVLPRPRTRSAWAAPLLLVLAVVLVAGLGRRLCERRALKDPAPDAPVFRDALSSQKAFQTWFNRRFREYATRTDVPVRVSSHTIRRSANTHSIAHGAPELFLKRQGAWSIASAWDAYCLQDMETYREKGLESLALD